MRTIIHLSDLHFGRVDPALTQPLLDHVTATSPDLVVVSGDFTQRALTAQFREARAFLDRIPFPTLVVPGNHDIPLWNFPARFLWPLRNYRRHITGDLQPVFQDAELCVIGVNTARSLTRMYGRIGREEIERLRAQFGAAPDHLSKILVTHHPFDLPPGYKNHRQLVGRAALAMKTLAASGVDLLLSGHLHLVHTGLTAERYKITGHSALVVQAGTATSTRGRGEVNSYNIIRIDHGSIVVERIEWMAEEALFRLASTGRYIRRESAWEEELRKS